MESLSFCAFLLLQAPPPSNLDLGFSLSYQPALPPFHCPLLSCLTMGVESLSFAPFVASSSSSSFRFRVLILYPALIQAMATFSTVLAESLESFSCLSTCASYSFFLTLQRHQILLNLVYSDRRKSTPCFLFLVLRSTPHVSQRFCSMDLTCVTPFTSTLLQRSHLGGHRVDLHGTASCHQSGRPF